MSILSGNFWYIVDTIDPIIYVLLMIGVGCESVLSFLLAIISVVAMLPYFTSYAGRKLKIRKQRKIMKDKLMTIATKLGSSLESNLYSKYK